jgi:hypothetical protein
MTTRRRPKENPPDGLKEVIRHIGNLRGKECNRVIVRVDRGFGSREFGSDGKRQGKNRVRRSRDREIPEPLSSTEHIAGP